MKSIQEWYSDYKILAYFKKILKNKELCLIQPTHVNAAYACSRPWKVNSGIQFTQVLKAHNYPEKLYNVYHSLATFKNGIPNMSFNFSKNTDTKQAWNQIYYTQVREYDLIVDIDALEMETVTEIAQLTYDFCDKITYPHTIHYSGMGFHVRIFMPDRKKPNLTFNPFMKPNYYTKLRAYVRLRIPTRAHKRGYQQLYGKVDYRILDSRRVIKIPFSLALYKHDTFVVAPINNKEELRKFNYKHYTLEYYSEKPLDFTTTIFNYDHKVNYPLWLEEFKQTMTPKQTEQARDSFLNLETTSPTKKHSDKPAYRSLKKTASKAKDKEDSSKKSKKNTKDNTPTSSKKQSNKE